MLEEFENIDHSQLVSIVRELVIKNNSLEKKLDDILSQLDKISCGIPLSGVAVPSTSISPQYHFNDLPNQIVITMQHIESLKDLNITQVMINILEEMQPPLPMLSFSHKLYVYSAQGSWKECSNEELIVFLNKIHQKFVKEMCEWYSNNKTQINASDQMSVSYNKMMIKLMGIDFKNKGTLSKIKSKLCKYLKSLTL